MAVFMAGYSGDMERMFRDGGNQGLVLRSNPFYSSIHVLVHAPIIALPSYSNSMLILWKARRFHMKEAFEFDDFTDEELRVVMKVRRTDHTMQYLTFSSLSP